MNKFLFSIAGLTVASNIFAQKPNIVYIFTDQQTASAMSCAGNPDINTPNIDRLANEGIRFTNAYCSSPLSTPSRASMFTGLPSENTQMLVNGSIIATDIRPKMLGNLLKDVGYDCAYAGKWHLPTNRIETGEWGFHVLHNSTDKGLAESCSEFLEDTHTKPFFLVASFMNPHNICEYARGQKLPNATIQASPLAKCPTVPSNFAIPLYEPDAIRSEQHANASLYPTLTYTDDDWRRYRDTYYRLVEHIDVEIGKIYKALERNKLLDNTIIIVSSDHGDGVGAHHWNQKSVLYEEVVNIPLIVRLPKACNAGQVKVQLVNNGIDVFATICDYAGAKLPARYQGISLRAILEDKNNREELHPYVVSETLFDRGNTYGWMLRTPRFKYIYYDNGKLREQLFDFKNDRAEMVNLAVQNEYADSLKVFRQLLVNWKQSNKVKYIQKNMIK
jgi:arylsulfatase A-like enzyme